jgi:hypothetical protein
MEKRMTLHTVIENSAMGAATEMNLVLGNSRCRRCDGLMVQEHCMDLFDDTGQMDFPALRCVQCGEVVDAVILLNRQRPPLPDARRPTRWTMKHRVSSSVH